MKRWEIIIVAFIIVAFIAGVVAILSNVPKRPRYVPFHDEDKMIVEYKDNFYKLVPLKLVEDK